MFEWCHIIPMILIFQPASCPWFERVLITEVVSTASSSSQVEGGIVSLCPRGLVGGPGTGTEATSSGAGCRSGIRRVAWLSGKLSRTLWAPPDPYVPSRDGASHRYLPPRVRIGTHCNAFNCVHNRWVQLLTGASWDKKNWFNPWRCRMTYLFVYIV